MVVSFVLSNADFPPLSTVSKLHSTSIDALSDKHISNTTTVTPFSKTVLPISKNFVPEDKTVCQWLRNTSCKSEFVPIKRHTVNHVSCFMFYGLNDCHKLISTFMRPEKQKKIFRNYIKFDETKFLFGFGKIQISANLNENYLFLTNSFASNQRKSIKHFSNITSKGIIINKRIWIAIKPFLTNKGCLGNSGVVLRDDKKIITDEKNLAQLFNDHYINIVERSCSIKTEKVEFDIGSRNKN